MLPGSRLLPSSWPSTPLFWIPLGALLSFILSWRLFFLPMVSDEGGYAYAAQRWFDGRGSLYHDVWISRPQAIFVVYGLIIDALGGATSDFRIVAWLFGVATMCVVWKLASTWYGSSVAALATMLFAIILGSPAIEGFTANAEVFMALPAALAVLTTWVASQRRWSWTWLMLTGALIGLATQLKPSGIVMLAVSIGFAAVMIGDGEPFTRRLAARSSWILGGFGLSLVPALYHGYRIGWDAFVYAAAGYRLAHQSSATNSLHHHIEAIQLLSARIWPAYLVIGMVIMLRWATANERVENLSAYRPRPALGIVSLPEGLTSHEPAFRLLQFWLIGCALGIAMGGDWWYHYMIQIAAPFAIWLALAITRLRPRLTRDLYTLVVACTFLFLLTPYSVLANTSQAQMTEDIFGHPGYVGQEALAQYLREHTDADTAIFVAFDQAAVYYLADRPSTYRYLYDQELRAFPEAEDDLIAMVESPNRPEYIVGTRQRAPFSDRGLAFWEAVQRHYTYETSVWGVPIYKANPEPPTTP